MALQVYLKDISKRGMGLFVQDEARHLFQKGRHLELSGYEQINLKTPLLGKVIYVKDALEQKYIGNKVGVQMSELIPDSILNAITNINTRTFMHELMSSNLHSFESQEMIALDISKIVEKMKKRPGTASCMKELEAGLARDSYMSDQIYVLIMVCAFLARSVNWVSEASMEKFIYAAYIQHAPFAKFPRLAQIKNMAEFEAIQGQLKNEEIVAFLNAPEASSIIAQNDPAAPPDVAQMLLLQKELPNGEGFYRKTISKIKPLPALYIVAQDLTYEIMRNSSWDLKHWAEGAKVTFTGGGFSKIMQSLGH
jgi:hypothetical protein